MHVDHIHLAPRSSSQIHSLVNLLLQLCVRLKKNLSRLILLGCVVFHRSMVTCQGYTRRQNCFSLSQKLIVINSFMARSRIVYLTLLSTAGVWYGLGLSRFCICGYSLCEFICGAALLCAGDRAPLELFAAYSSYTVVALIPELWVSPFLGASL